VRWLHHGTIGVSLGISVVDMESYALSLGYLTNNSVLHLSSYRAKQALAFEGVLTCHCRKCTTCITKKSPCSTDRTDCTECLARILRYILSRHCNKDLAGVK
jgi:hypothetical protein